MGLVLKAKGANLFQLQVAHVEACDGTFKHPDASHIYLDLSSLENDCKRAFKLKNSILFRMELE